MVDDQHHRRERNMRRVTGQVLFALLILAVGRGAIGAEPCGEPQLRPVIAGDAAADAAGRGQIFEAIVVPGVTDRFLDTAGTAIADINRDGMLDIVVVHSGYRTDSHTLKLMLNRGCFRFSEHPVRITGSEISTEELGKGVQIPNLVDFNNDGFLDILLTRSGLTTCGNTLLLSDGGFDRFVDRSTELDVRNLTAYSRQSSIADVDGDGWLDVGVASDNIGDTRIGRPIQRLYLYRPAGEHFEDGSFEDIGGTKLVPGFGGEFAGDPRIDKAGPQLSLRDLDNDGWQDLLWVDRFQIPPHWGIQRNMLFMNNADGTFRPVNADVSGLDDTCTSVETADLNNDGLLDVVCVNTPGNNSTGRKMPDDRYGDKVFWNTGAHGGADNHWLRVRFSGVSDHRLIGAHVFAYEVGTSPGGDPRLVGMRSIHSNHSYRTGSPLEAHFGLGPVDRVDLVVQLINGGHNRFENVRSDRLVDLDLRNGIATPVTPPSAAE
jgi:hypothetical protein